MNDTELANRVVAIGVGSKCVDADLYDWSTAWTDAWQKDRMCKTKPADFGRDWRVAGALMERMNGQEVLIWAQHYEEADSVWIVELGDSPRGSPSDGRDESLPRAIIMACLEALE